MSRAKKMLLALTVIGASLLPASEALAGIQLQNHNETLPQDWARLVNAVRSSEDAMRSAATAGIGASFVAAADALPGLALSNHSETLWEEE